MFLLYRIAIPLLGRFYQVHSLFIFIIPAAMAFFSKSVTVTGIPTIFASIAWGVFSSRRFSHLEFFFSLFSFVALFIFITHPAASGAELYAAYWLIIPFCGLLLSVIRNAHVRLFLIATISAYVAHAVGSLIYIHTIPTTPIFWQSIAHRVWIERLVMTVTLMCIDYLMDFFFIFSAKAKPANFFLG